MSFSFGAPAPTGDQESAPAPAFSFGRGSDGKAPAPSFGEFGSKDAKAPAFGGSSAAPSFGGFGSSSDLSKAAPNFGSATTDAKPAFGGFGSGGEKAPAPAFADFGGGDKKDGAKPSFGGFGTDKTSGDSKPAPTFGGFGGAAKAGDAKPAPSFGGFAKTDTKPDGDAKPAPAFGGFGTSSGGEAKSAAAPAFGGVSTDSTKAASTDTKTTPAFGGFGDKKELKVTPAFASPAPSFGTKPADAKPSFGAPAPAAAPSFGKTDAKAGSDDRSKPSVSFGQTDTKTPSFGSTAGKTATPSFGTPSAGAPAPVATPQTTPAASAKTLEPPKLSFDYQTQSVEQIMNLFQKELEQDAIKYLEQARRVAHDDAVLRDAQRDISELSMQAHRTLLEQEQLQKSLKTISQTQVGLENSLEKVENIIDELFAKKSNLPPMDADVEREKAYGLADSIGQQLMALEEAIAAKTREVHESQAKALPGTTGKILQIINQHERTLMELQGKGRQLETDVGQISKMLDTKVHVR